MDLAQLNKELKGLSKSIKTCLHNSGYNKRSFEYCCGANFKNIEKAYYKLYLKTSESIKTDFASKIKFVCHFDNTPCKKLLQDFNENIKNKSDVYQAMQKSKAEVYTSNSINRKLLDLELQKFKKNTEVYNEQKEMIVHSFINVVHYIQSFENQNNQGRKIEQITNYDPKNFLDQIKFDIKAVHQKRGNDNFNQSLQKEFVPMKLLNYYLSSGILKKNDIDLGKLPSQIINDLSNDKNDDLI